MTPHETILQQLPAVCGAFARGRGPAGAWNILLAACPALTASMTYNTFKTVAPSILKTAERFHSDCATPGTEPSETLENVLK